MAITVIPTTVMLPTLLPTTDMDMPTMDTTRGLLMLRLLTDMVMPHTLMPITVMLPTLLPTTDMDMPTMDTTRGPLMLRLLTAMVMPHTLMPTTDMLPTDLMPIMATAMDTITNLLNTIKS